MSSAALEPHIHVELDNIAKWSLQKAVRVRVIPARHRQPHTFVTLRNVAGCDREGGCLVRLGLCPSLIHTEIDEQREWPGCLTGDCCCSYEGCLAKACSDADLPRVLALLARGHRPEGRKSDWWQGERNLTPLMSAAMQNHVGIIESLLVAGAPLTFTEEDFDHDLPEFGDAAWCAAKSGSTDALAFLLQKGAPVESCTIDGETSLLMACQKAHIGCVRLLLAAGAKVNHATGDRMGCTQDGFPYDLVGPTPLIIACRGIVKTKSISVGPGRCRRFKVQQVDEQLQLELVTLLLDHGADPNYVCGEDCEFRQFALRAACEAAGCRPSWIPMEHHQPPRIELVKLLLHRGADPSIDYVEWGWDDAHNVWADAAAPWSSETHYIHPKATRNLVYLLLLQATHRMPLPLDVWLENILPHAFPSRSWFSRRR